MACERDGILSLPCQSEPHQQITGICEFMYAKGGRLHFWGIYLSMLRFEQFVCYALNSWRVTEEACVSLYPTQLVVMQWQARAGEWVGIGKKMKCWPKSRRGSVWKYIFLRILMPITNKSISDLFLGPFALSTLNTLHDLISLYFSSYVDFKKQKHGTPTEYFCNHSLMRKAKLFYNVFSLGFFKPEWLWFSKLEMT